MTQTIATPAPAARHGLTWQKVVLGDWTRLVRDPIDVVGQPAQLELRRGDAVTLCLQVLDDGAPTRAVGPGAVHEDDVGQRGHASVLPSAPRRTRMACSMAAVAAQLGRTGFSIMKSWIVPL